MSLSSLGGFRRAGPGDDRRRRVLTDTLGDTLAGDVPVFRPITSQTTRPAPVQKSEHYGDASFMDDSLRVTDLIPRRLAHFALLLALGLGVIGGLELLHAWMPKLVRYAGHGATSFDLHASNSLAAWFSSTLLNLSGLVAMLVFSVRRFRTDDYGGRYRIWVWAAVCCFLASIDVTASFHDAFKETLCRMSGTRILGDGSLWWVVAWLFLLGGVGLRLLVDMSECRLSTAILAAGFAACLFSIAARFGLPVGLNGNGRVMLVEGVHLTGILFVLIALGLHARHVILDAEGLLDSSVDEEEEEADAFDEIPIVNRSKPSRSDLSEPKWGVPQAAHPAPQPPIKKPAPPIAAPSAARTIAGAPKASPAAKPLAGGLAQTPPPHQQKLSKAEKKALRKRLLDMRREREE